MAEPDSTMNIDPAGKRPLFREDSPPSSRKRPLFREDPPPSSREGPLFRPDPASTSTGNQASSKMISIPDPPNSDFKQISRQQAGVALLDSVNGLISMLQDVKKASLYSYDKRVWPVHKLDQILCRLHKSVDDTCEIVKISNSTCYYEFKLDESKVPVLPDSF